MYVQLVIVLVRSEVVSECDGVITGLMESFRVRAGLSAMPNRLARYSETTSEW